MDGQDVRVIQRGDVDRFVFEAMARRPIGNVAREHFDGDETLQAGVTSQEHPAHAAGPKLGFDDVRPDPFARRYRHCW